MKKKVILEYTDSDVIELNQLYFEYINGIDKFFISDLDFVKELIRLLQDNKKFFLIPLKNK